MTWQLNRITNADGNGYDRYYDPIAGAAVVYEEVDDRLVWGFVNGEYFETEWPDTGALFDGDRGRPLHYRIRPEYFEGVVTGWWLYVYVYSGGIRRSEWKVQVA